MRVDLTTHYLGLTLRNPVVASACPLTGELDSLLRLEHAGVGAVVLPSLFEEQIEHEEMELHRVREFGAESFAEALSYFPELEDYNTGPESYLELIESAKKQCTVPVIASLNGTSKGGWVRYAREIEQAGADALELNVYFLATDPDATADQVESQYLDLVSAVRETVSVPLAVKIGPYFSSLPNMARRLVAAGAAGLVLFNRFMQPDIDLERLAVDPQVELSTAVEMRLPLRWIAILRPQLSVSLAATTGVHTADDVLKLLLVGADVAMSASALLKHGPDHVRTLVEGVRRWMEAKAYDSVDQMKGSMSAGHAPDPGAFERANYMKALTSYTTESR
jgi:dihydroorotate dehydrogenase (fumarate)